MWDEEIPSEMGGSGEAPIPIPPVDESWSRMRGALDVRMPVAKPFYVRPRFLGAVVCGAVLTAVVVKGIHHSAGPVGVGKVERGVVVKGGQAEAVPGGGGVVGAGDGKDGGGGAVGEGKGGSSAVGDEKGNGGVEKARVDSGKGGGVEGKAARGDGKVIGGDGKVIGGGDVARGDGKVGEAGSGAGTVTGTGRKGGEAELKNRVGGNGGEFATISDAGGGGSSAGNKAGKAGNREDGAGTAGKVGSKVSKAGKAGKAESEVTGTEVKTGEGAGKVSADRSKEVEGEGKVVGVIGLVGRDGLDGKDGKALWEWVAPRRVDLAAGAEGAGAGAAGAGAMGVGDLRFRLADTLLRKWRPRQGGGLIPASKRPAMAPAHYLTAGLSLAKNFPIGQQQQYPIGVTGNPGTLADYIPSAHVRAYSGSWDLQLDVRFIAPQYTRSEAIDSSGGDSSAIFPFQGYRQYNVFILKKLYYSQIAVGADREVVKGLWLGAGMSFGRLTSAYGSQEILLKATNPGVRDTVYSSSVVNAKYNDTAYNRLSRSDWRLMLNAEYRWHRWTVGFRYERSLNPYLSIQGDGSKGTERNQQFSLHLGYELWQGRR